jgi:hypothetical protein
MRLGHRARVGLIGTCAVLVALIAIAFAVGGSGSKSNSNRSTTTAGYGVAPADGIGVAGAPVPSTVPLRHPGAQSPRLPAAGAAPVVAPQPALAAHRGIAPAPDSADELSAVGAPTTAGGGGSSGSNSSGADSAKLTRTSSSIDATKIIKTGNLTIRVPKLAVKEAIQRLTVLATTQGGYVSGSTTSLDSSNPYGEIVLRIPVAHFQDTIDAAEKGQKVVALTTSADDVTGKFVDLSAKKRALERSRSTYLTILSRARTIGETLAVQQRIDDVQQQIDQLHGQLKLLGNQASYSTLTVDVVAAGVKTFAATHHQRHGIGKAWHDSWSRFGRGINAIVGAIGPIVFAVLLLAVLGLIGYGGYRGFRRATGHSQAAA